MTKPDRNQHRLRVHVRDDQLEELLTDPRPVRAELPALVRLVLALVGWMFVAGLLVLAGLLVAWAVVFVVRQMGI